MLEPAKIIEEPKKDNLAYLRGECNGVEIEIKSDNLLQEAKTSALNYETCFKLFKIIYSNFFF